MPDAPKLVRVAVPVPLAEGFDYVWHGDGAPPAPGSRVRVPFGRGERIGIVLEHPQLSLLPPEKLKPLGAALEPMPLVDAALLDTLKWAADYYHHPIGEVVQHALPGLLRKGRALTAPAGGAKNSPGPDTGGTADEPAPDPPALTPDQAEVLARLAHDGGMRFETCLLHGVTGSGKTEIFMRLAAEQIDAGRQTLLLVPEIGLTPQLVARLRRRFGRVLAVLHSALTERERAAAWRMAHAVEAMLVVGTRSAVFAPLPAAGLIIVDEEHDTSYKQQDGFRYSARDIAIVRARGLRVRVVLASATPSLESMHNARRNRYRLLSLPRRVGAAMPPAMRVVDLRMHASRQGLSTPLLASMDAHLEQGNQVLLFLNRRGFAPALFCPQCQTVEECDRCDARLTVHARNGTVTCHHCGRERPLRWACGRCAAERIAVGAGTQRVTEALQSLYPGRRIARLDRDVTARRGALARVLDDVERGDTQILVGTQMLTKGHDFPRVTLVGVLNADQGLFGTDFRSGERLAQTIVQVAGRAGRRERPGEVVIQTHFPGHPLLRSLLRGDYAAFAALALEERRLAGWPPFAHLAVWRAEAASRARVFEFLEKVRAHAAAQGRSVQVLGPAPAAMERRGGRFRAQLVFQSGARRTLHALLGATLAAARQWREARRVRWALDVDPAEL